MGNGLRELREERGWTHEEAAQAVGVSRSHFIKLERSERGLTEHTISRAARAFSVPRVRVLGDEVAGGDAVETRPHEPDAPNVRQPRQAQGVDLTKLKGPRNVPVLGTGVAGSEGDFRFNGQTIDHAPRPPGVEDKPDVYVVYVVGDSMLEKFEDGDPLYIDPRRRAKARDFVVVELHGTSEGEPGEAFVKRLVRRGGGKIVVEQFNPRKELTFDEARVKHVHRVIPWVEVMGL